METTTATELRLMLDVWADDVPAPVREAIEAHLSTSLDQSSVLKLIVDTAWNAGAASVRKVAGSESQGERRGPDAALATLPEPASTRHDAPIAVQSNASMAAQYQPTVDEVLEHARCTADLNRRVCELTACLEQIANSGPHGAAWCIATARVALGWDSPAHAEAQSASSTPPEDQPGEAKSISLSDIPIPVKGEQ